MSYRFLNFFFGGAAFLFVFFAYAQNSNQYETVTGFKDIELGAHIDSVKGNKKLKKEIKENEVPARVYTVEHPDYDSISEVKVVDIELKVYANLIYEIRVITEKDQRLMKALESRYGKAGYSGTNSIYFWKGQESILKFSANSKKTLLLVYSSYAVLNKIKKDKMKKVDDIADDF